LDYPPIDQLRYEHINRNRNKSKLFILALKDEAFRQRVVKRDMVNAKPKPCVVKKPRAL